MTAPIFFTLSLNKNNRKDIVFVYFLYTVLYFFQNKNQKYLFILLKIFVIIFYHAEFIRTSSP